VNVDLVTKVKVKCTLQQAVKAWYRSTVYLTSALDRGGCSAPHLGHFVPGKTQVTHCTGGWVDPQGQSGWEWKISASVFVTNMFCWLFGVWMLCYITTTFVEQWFTVVSEVVNHQVS